MSVNHKSKTTFLNKQKVEIIIWIFTKGTFKKKGNDSRGRSKLQEGEMNQESIIIHLNANLNKYCKIDIYNLNVKIITLIWGKRSFKRKRTEILLFVLLLEIRREVIRVNGM